MKRETSPRHGLAILAATLMAASLTGFASAAEVVAPWHDAAWAKRQPITIDHHVVDGNLVDFPVLITEAGLQASLFAAAKSDGSDIVVTAGDGVTRLARELVDFDAERMRLELYFKAPLLSSAVDTLFYIYYGNPAASLGNDDETWDDRYVMVQHMNDASATAILGSTRHHHLGVKGDVEDPDPVNHVNPSVEVDGKIGKAQSFDHSWIDVGVHDEFNLTEHLTVEAWGHAPDRADIYNSTLVCHDLLATGRQWNLLLMDGAKATLQVNVPWDERAQGPNPLFLEWNHLVGVYDIDNEHAVFLNGTKYSRGPSGALNNSPDTPLLIGTHYRYNWTASPGWLGPIDELRVSRVPRSDEWIVTGYRNQLDPSAFYRAGDEEIRVPVYACVGFERPLDGGRVKVHRERVLPLRASLHDPDGLLVTDLDVAAPPVVQVMFRPYRNEEAADVTNDALLPGEGTAGNQFVFTAVGNWQYNLATEDHPAPGAYRMTMESGDASEYMIDPTCDAIFIRR